MLLKLQLPKPSKELRNELKFEVLMKLALYSLMISLAPSLAIAHATAAADWKCVEQGKNAWDAMSISSSEDGQLTLQTRDLDDDQWGEYLGYPKADVTLVSDDSQKLVL